MFYLSSIYENVTKEKLEQSLSAILSIVASLRSDVNHLEKRVRSLERAMEKIKK